MTDKDNNKKSLMRKVFFLIINCLCVSICSFSQQTENKVNYNNQIKFSPVRMINLFNPGFELSYQRNYGKFATQISGAYLFGILNDDGFGREHIRGYRFVLEEKYFLQKITKGKTQFFLSSELAHNNTSYYTTKAYVGENEEYDIAEIENYESQKFNINRQTILLNVKFGLELRYKHFILEASAGLGLAFNNVQYLNKIPNTKIIAANHFEDLLSPIFETDGKTTMPNFPISFKIGYAF